jgi:hypothetical protein
MLFVVSQFCSANLGTSLNRSSHMGAGQTKAELDLSEARQSGVRSEEGVSPMTGSSLRARLFEQRVTF